MKLDLGQTTTLKRRAVLFRIVISAGLSLAALLWHGMWSLGCVTSACLLFAVYLRAWRVSWNRVAILILWQFAVVVLLYLLRFGGEGLLDGAQVSWRLVLVFMPGMLVMRTTAHGAIARLLSGLLPARLGFIVSTCILFFPTLWAETLKTYECQILKGARILPRELLNPLNWKDLIGAVCLPAIMNSLILARDLAHAAECRWYGLHETRTLWPGPGEEE